MAGFLIDASLPRAVADVLRSAGHEAVDVRDIGLGAAGDAAVAAHAAGQGLCLITRDGDFGNILEYPPARYGGIVVLKTARSSGGRRAVLDLTSAFLANREVVAALKGRLVIVEPGRLRVRAGS
jgi:hypothetical protein